MSYAAQIVTYLKTDSTLLGFATGGVINFPDSGRKGLNRVQEVSAYVQQTGIIKPTVIIYEVATIADYQIIDMPSGNMSVQGPLIGYIYQEGDEAYVVVEQIEKRLYQLLHNFRAPPIRRILWTSTPLNKRDPLLDEAGFYAFGAKVYASRTFV